MTQPNAPKKFGEMRMAELVVWHRDGTASRYAMREMEPNYYCFELDVRADMAVPLLPSDEITIEVRVPFNAGSAYHEPRLGTARR